MNIWQTLRIEPTTDIKIIKEAYAQKAKEKHPEEHPEEFKQLQAAYKAAMKYAKGQESGYEQPLQSFEETEEIFRETPENEQSAYDTYTTFEHISEEPPTSKMQSFDYDGIPKTFRETETEKEKFRRELEYMLRHPYMRQIPAYWKCFFDKAEYRTLMENEEFRQNIFDRLCWENYFFHTEAREFFVTYWKQLGTEIDDARLIRNSILSFKLSECETKQEKQVYDSIWNRNHHSSGENAEKYLDTYFQYAEMNDEKLREIYCGANEARNRKALARKFVVTIFFVLLFRFIIRKIF